ncbi:hypothetical protein Scep_006717 [Stephania cephalantha]|uniref:DUF4283 domain-containing protein n=1 Tax=Stephania cephalantha TaxID=152367 RepID=A0AAP0KB81_9MAGN
MAPTISINPYVTFKDDVAMEEDDKDENEDYHPIDVEVNDGDIQGERVENTLKLSFSDKLVDQMDLSMNNTVMVKLLGRSIGFHTLQLRLQSLWAPKGNMNIMDLENGYLMVRLTSTTDYVKALLGGPWVILGHYLTVKPQSPSFSVNAPNLSDVATWIRFPSLPLEYYHK